MTKIKEVKQTFHPRARAGLVGLHESPRAVVKFELERSRKLYMIKMCVLAMDERYRNPDTGAGVGVLYEENGEKLYSAQNPELSLYDSLLRVYLRGARKERDLVWVRLGLRMSLADAKTMVRRCLKLLAGWEIAEIKKERLGPPAAPAIEIESLPRAESTPEVVRGPLPLARLAELAGRCCKLAEEGLLNENNVRQAIKHEALLEEILRSSARHLTNATRLGELLKKFEQAPE